MTSQNGLMLALMQPPAGLEEEFSDWYDTEHLPQRRGLPGFLSGQRWVAVEGFPQSLAAYELTTLAALADPAYRAVSGANSTPWSQRMLARTARAGRMRANLEQVWPGHARFLPTSRTARLLVARYGGLGGIGEEQALIDEARASAATLPALAQLRLFANQREEGQGGKQDDTREVWALAEFAAPTTLSILAPLFGQLAGHGADLFNLYAPYDKNMPR
jgi:hypothetical protein